MVVSAACDSPCKGCPDRKLHCHGSCEKYKAYKAALEENKKESVAKTEMTNFLRVEKREVTNMNIYDLLVKISGSMVEGCSCVIEAVTGKRQDCKYNIVDKGGCPDCLQKWLNEEEKKNA